MAKCVIVDPEIHLTLPKRQILAGGLDILTHLAEFYVTEPETLPVNDGFKEVLMKVVIKYLPIAAKNPNDMVARTELAWASNCAMGGFARIGGTQGIMACHGMEEAMSGRFDICHGKASPLSSPPGCAMSNRSEKNVTACSLKMSSVD